MTVLLHTTAGTFFVDGSVSAVAQQISEAPMTLVPARHLITGEDGFVFPHYIVALTNWRGALPGVAKGRDARLKLVRDGEQPTGDGAA